MHKNRGFELWFSVLLLGIIGSISCTEQKEQNPIPHLEQGEFLVAAQLKLTEVIIHDIFSPPVASRIYVYPALAAYEVAVLADPERYASLGGQLNDFPALQVSVSEDKTFSYPLAAAHAYYTVAKALIFSEEMMDNHYAQLLQHVRDAGMTKKEIAASEALGSEVAAHILAFAKKDNYHESRSFEKYAISDDPGTWQPTPPAYMEGIEPHWNTIRPLVMEHAHQFPVPPPPAFSTEPGSAFYRDAEEVFTITQNLSPEQRDIAFFWDCNPYKMNVRGHVMFAEKKITPGGHWMGIAAIAAKTAGADWLGYAEALALTGVALFDGFIACWDEKYRSALIRPETYINRYIDEEWLPLLQTPPFPEYTSGHSVISNAAAETLTAIFGEPFAFVDSTEVAYGLPIRNFDSFRQAADEAAISRLYGGIHYMPAITYGADKGKALAEHFLGKVHWQKQGTGLVLAAEGKRPADQELPTVAVEEPAKD
ncbi:MAG: vanadium-dependent haloperoxidase [Nitritalea sp.]